MTGPSSASVGVLPGLRTSLLRVAGRVAAGLVVAVGLMAAPAGGQTPDGPPPVDTTGLASGPFATMEMLYERTIFNVDVLRLTLHFGPETARELEAVARDRSGSDELEDELALTALRAREAMVRSRFLRDVSLDQFLDGLRESVGNARERGLISAREEEVILSETEEQYAPLRKRGIREGEIMWYRISGDTLDVAFQALDGEVLVRSRPVGPERRLAVLGGYLAPGSDFREELVRSLPLQGER